MRLVTAILLQRDGRMTFDAERYFDLLEPIVQTGVPITLFLDKAFGARSFASNVEVRRLTIRDLWMYQACESVEVVLPSHRTIEKDTLDYLIIQNSKTELVSATEGPANERVAWVDAGLSRIFRNPNTVNLLRVLDECPTELTVPGCWSPQPFTPERICWRFCGGFFCGSRRAAADFDGRHGAIVKSLLPNVTWEVNVWALMEALGDPFRWYQADHDDTLLHFPVGG